VASPARPADHHKVTAAQLAKTYRRLAPTGVTTQMRRGLRAWLRAHEPVDQRTLDAFVDQQTHGVRITLAALAHDPATEDLMAPELLLVLRALDDDPDALRAQWPSDPRDLHLLADAYGRPYTR
jgi:hypothetical protein